MENRPNQYRPKPDQEQTPREAGEGRGSAKPQVEQTKQFSGGFVFDKSPIMPIILSPSEIQHKYPFEITKEQALEESQPWLERLKRFDRQELERRLAVTEKFKRETFLKLRERYRTPQQAELLDYQMEAIRAELRQRGSE